MTSLFINPPVARRRSAPRAARPAGNAEPPWPTYPGLVQAPTLEQDKGVYTFTCPRCQREVAERFYGPCGQCRDQLNDAFYRPPASGAEVERPRFEPKMHVVPNDVTARVEREDPGEAEESD